MAEDRSHVGLIPEVAVRTPEARFLPSRCRSHIGKFRGAQVLSCVDGRACSLNFHVKGLGSLQISNSEDLPRQIKYVEERLLVWR